MALEKPSFNWNAPDKYVELFNLTGEEKVLFIKNWLDKKGLQLIKSFTSAQKETHKTAKRLASILSQKFMPYPNSFITTVLQVQEKA